MSIPGIPESSRTKVYRRICDQLRTDPVIGGRVEWVFRSGDRNDVVAFALDKPTIRLTPKMGPGEFKYADGQRNDLIVEIEMAVPNTPAATDFLDLWTAVEQAIYPFNQLEKQQKFKRALGELGAEIGEILFNNPPNPEDVREENGAFGFYGKGTFTVSVRRTFNP